MQQLKKIEEKGTEALSGKSVCLFLQSKMVVLSGSWYWDLFSDAVFCSDVILSTPIQFSGTKGILHPDDKEKIVALLQEGNQWTELQFRIITTYGEVKNLIGHNISVEEDAEETERMLAAIFEQSESPQKIKSKLALLSSVYTHTEKQTEAGMWYHNRSTHETWYSNQLFKIYDLPPASLNAHLNTFNAFIHPDDKETVNQFFDKAYQYQVPLHVEYRIITPRAEKTIQHLTQWVVSPAGETLWCGTVQDITDQKKEEQQAQEATLAAQFGHQLLQLDAQHAGIGHWHLNLLTRKAFYSDNVYRLFGVKAQSLTPGLKTFLNFIHPEDREHYENAIRRMIKEHHLPEMQYRIMRSDGKVRHISQKAKLVYVGEELVIAGIMQDVTLQHAMESKIAQLNENAALSQQAQLQLADMAGLGSWTWKLQSGEVEWSEGFFKLLGLRPQPAPLTQKQLLSFIHSDDHKKLTDAIALMQQRHPETAFEFRLLQRGEVKVVKALFRLVENEADSLFIATFQDVTAAATAQQQLHRQVQLAEALSQNLPERIVIVDNDYRILLWNGPCEDFYKIKSNDAVGKNYFEVIPSKAAANELNLFNRVLQGETIDIAEAGPDGAKRYHKLHVSPLWSEDGKEVVGIIQKERDITEEYKLRQNLKERLNFIQSIVESSVDPIIALDSHMNYMVWNKQCEKLYGLSKEEVIGKNILEVFPEMRATPAYNDFRRVLRGETVYLPPKPDIEHPYYFETYLLPVRNEKEEIIAVLWTQHDLSKEMDLNVQKQKIQHIIESLNEGYFELDHNLCFTYINSVAEAFWKKKEEELLGQYFLEVFPQAEKSTIFNDMMAAIQTGQPSRGQYLSPITGNWIHVSFAPTGSGITIIFYDINKIKVAEIAVRENQYLLQQINESIPDALTIFDLERGENVYLNNSLAQWTGQSSVALQQMGSAGRLQLIHADDREQVLHFNESLKNLQDGEVAAHEYRLLALQGTIWVRSRNKVFRRNSVGAPTQILNILQNITEEVQLRQRLEERTQYAKIIFDEGIDQMMLLDTTFTVIDWNRRSEEITGIKKEAAIGKNIFELFPKLAQDAVIYNAFQQAAAGNFVQLSPKKALYSNGVFERFYKPIKNSNGVTYAILLIIHDISSMMRQSEELKELNKTLKKKNQELEQKNEEIMHFSFVASHDLKEPLRKMHLFTDWLLHNERESLSDSGQNYLDRMSDAVQRIEWLIEDILVLTKIHSDTHHTDEINLQHLLQQVQADMKEEIHLSGASIQIGTLPTILGNNHQLFYLFKNLLDNAIKFQPQGSIPQVSLSATVVTHPQQENTEEGNEFLKIECVDNGIGFSNTYAKKIFRIFQRLHSKEQFDGTGIGLAICKKIMENHEGFIEAVSKEGKGSVFSCYFPAASIVAV